MFATAVRSALASEGVLQTVIKEAAAHSETVSPLPLYRRVLRAHRRLPKEMRILGDGYVKDEFRRCRKIDNPLHVVGFLTQWRKYCEGVEQGIDGQEPAQAVKPADSKDFEGMIEKLNAEQIGQLYELMNAAKEVWKPVPEGDQSALDALQAASDSVKSDKKRR